MGETDLFTGVATLLDTAGIGSYSATGTYTSGQTAIVMGVLPQDPTAAIALTPYTVSDEPPPSSDTILGLQVQLRGDTDPRTVKDLSASIFGALHGLERTQMGGLFVALVWRQSGRLDGRDDQLRWLSVENYYARVNWPTAYRTDT